MFGPLLPESTKPLVIIKRRLVNKTNDPYNTHPDDGDQQALSTRVAQSEWAEFFFLLRSPPHRSLLRVPKQSDVRRRR